MSENAPLQPNEKAKMLRAMPIGGIGLAAKAETIPTLFEKQVMSGDHPFAARIKENYRRNSRHETAKEFLTAAHDGFITTLNKLFAPVSRPVESAVSKAVAKIRAYTKG